jgi:hypothetical protein
VADSSSTSAGGASAPASISDGRALRPCLCHNAFAGSEAPFTFNVTGNYDSSYFCRGMDIGDNLFAVTATADLKLSDSLTWTASFRYMDVTDADFTELNGYTGLFYTTGDLTIGPSFRWYQFRPGGGEMNAYDLGLQALYKAGPADITAGYYYETESEGSYLELGVSSTFKITEQVSLVPSAEVSYTDGWVNPALSGMNAFNLRLAAPVRVSKNVSVVPYIGFQIPLEALEEAQNDKLFGGVSLSVSF